MTKKTSVKMSEVFGLCTERIDHVVMVYRLVPGINTSTPQSKLLGLCTQRTDLVGIVYRLMPGIKEPTSLVPVPT
jgi:hypothetical protein